MTAITKGNRFAMCNPPVRSHFGNIPTELDRPKADIRFSKIRSGTHFLAERLETGWGARLSAGDSTGCLHSVTNERTRSDLLAHERFRDNRLMTILVSGASGLIGSELKHYLTTGGHRVVPLTRSDDPQAVHWSPAKGTIEREKLNGIDAVIHLAGENIFGRWTAYKKRAIYDSRVQGTRLLCEALASLTEKPKVLVCASAIGFYGSRGDEMLTEENSKGSGFLPDVCEAWEQACEPARQAGIRVVNVRSGPVLTPRGGMLGSLLPLFKAGLGGRVGTGDQWIGWIAIDDLLDIYLTALTDEELAGPLNATSPNPVTNAEFTRMLGGVLGRPTFCAVPEFAVKIVFGEAADELPLTSQRVIPQRLEQRSHPFRHAQLEDALRFLLGRGQQPSTAA